MQEISIKKYKTWDNWVGKVIKKLKFPYTNKWYIHNPESVRKEWDAQISLGFWDTIGSPNLGQTTKLSDSQQKREPDDFVVDFAVPADYRVKLKGEKRDKYLDLARELKKLWNMKMTVIPTVVGALVTIPKELVKGLEDLEMRTRRYHPD